MHLRWLAASAVVMLGLGCLKLDDATGKAGLYLFDSTSHAVMAWSDVSAIYAAGVAGTAERTITSSTKIGSAFALAQGGMVLDDLRQNLYLVSTGGKVVRISHIGSQAGELTSTADVIAFSIDDTGTDAATGTPVFGQAAVDATSNTLCVTESNGTNSQIWVIPLGAVADGATAGTQVSDTVQATLIGKTQVSGGTGDKGCIGVAAGSGSVYAYFQSGNAITQGGVTYAAADRLRKGTSAGFDPYDNLILGKTDNTRTLLAPYGCLAFDSDDSLLYAACQNGSATPLIAFRSNAFSSASVVEAAPDLLLGGPSGLRIIAHAGRKDWLAGASAGGSDLWLWKGPSGGTDAHLAIPLTGITIGGLALDGTS